MSKTTRNFIRVSIGIGIAGIIGIGAGTIILLNTDKLEKKAIASKFANISNDDLDIKITEFSMIGETTSEDEQYFLGVEGLKYFTKAITERLGFGPEFFSLRKIIIQGDNQEDTIIADSENGVYYPSAQTLVLNVNPLAEKLGIRNSETGYISNNSSVPVEARAEILFQTFYHEYLHHVANNYFTNLDLTDSYATRIQADAKEEPWNKSFLTDFKSALKYDQDFPTLYDEDYTRYNESNNQVRFSDRSRLISIGSYYDAQDLFNNSNTNIPSITDADLYKAATVNNGSYRLGFAPKRTNFTFTPPTAEYLKYLFTQQELFARKYQLLTFDYVTPKDIGTEWGTYKIGGTEKPTNYLNDVLNFQSGIKFDGISNNASQYANDGTDVYLQDNPLADEATADKLMEAYNTQKNVGQELSFIWNDVPVDIQNVDGKMQRNELTSRQVSDSLNRIKFGGYLTQSQHDAGYTRVGWFDGSKYTSVEIDIYDYKMNRVDELGGSRRINPDQMYTYKTSGNWINASSWEGKELYFATDSSGTNSQALTKTRNDGLGKVWNKKYYNPTEMNNIANASSSLNFYEANISNNGFVKIDAIT